MFKQKQRCTKPSPLPHIHTDRTSSPHHRTHRPGFVGCLDNGLPRGHNLKTRQMPPLAQGHPGRGSRGLDQPSGESFQRPVWSMGKPRGHIPHPPSHCRLSLYSRSRQAGAQAKAQKRMTSEEGPPSSAASRETRQPSRASSTGDEARGAVSTMV